MSLRILYLEDQPATVANLREFLLSWGHIVYQATTLKEALEILSAENIDLLLLDLMMKHGEELDAGVPPRQTGMEFLRRIRQSEEVGGHHVDEKLPIIVVTAVGDIYDLATVRSYGVEEILEKPVSAEYDLLPAIERISAIEAGE